MRLTPTEGCSDNQYASFAALWCSIADPAISLATPSELDSRVWRMLSSAVVVSATRMSEACQTTINFPIKPDVQHTRGTCRSFRVCSADRM